MPKRMRSFRLSPTILGMLAELREETGQDATFLVQEAIRLYHSGLKQRKQALLEEKREQERALEAKMRCIDAEKGAQEARKQEADDYEKNEGFWFSGE